jgi:hypothetical protein
MESLFGLGWLSTAVNVWLVFSSNSFQPVMLTSPGPVLYTSIHSLWVSVPVGLNMISVMVSVAPAFVMSAVASIRASIILSNVSIINYSKVLYCYPIDFTI